MRVLHVVHWPRSGIGVLVRDVVRHRSADMEHLLLSLAPGAPVTDELRAMGTAVDEPSVDRGIVSGASAVRKRIREFRPDVIHSHSVTPRVVTTMAAGGIPHVTTVHTQYAYFAERNARSVLKRGVEWLASAGITTYACVTHPVRTALPFRTMSNRATVVQNGVDLQAVRLAAAAEHERINGDPLLVAVGRLDAEKAFDRLLRAVALVRSAMPGLRLVICGDGVQRSELEALARTLGVDDAVRFLGHVSNAMPFLRDADALVLSSLFEGFPLTAGEAMALGRPVIATPVDGLRASLRDGDTAFFARGFEPADIAEVLSRALSDRARLRAVGDAGRCYAEQHLDVRRTVAAYERIYREVTS